MTLTAKEIAQLEHQAARIHELEEAPAVLDLVLEVLDEAKYAMREVAMWDEHHKAFSALRAQLEALGKEQRDER